MLHIDMELNGETNDSIIKIHGNCFQNIYKDQVIFEKFKEIHILHRIVINQL